MVFLGVSWFWQFLLIHHFTDCPLVWICPMYSPNWSEMMDFGKKTRRMMLCLCLCTTSGCSWYWYVLLLVILTLNTWIMWWLLGFSIANLLSYTFVVNKCLWGEFLDIMQILYLLKLCPQTLVSFSNALYYSVIHLAKLPYSWLYFPSYMTP